MEVLERVKQTQTLLMKIRSRETQSPLYNRLHTTRKQETVRDGVMGDVPEAQHTHRDRHQPRPVDGGNTQLDSHTAGHPEQKTDAEAKDPIQPKKVKPWAPMRTLYKSPRFTFECC
jgi:hypothetical protein